MLKKTRITVIANLFRSRVLMLFVILRNTVTFRRPLAEVDQLAALRAEGPPGVGRAIFGEVATCGAGDLFWRAYRLHRVRSKVTSASQGRGFCVPSRQLKRMLMAYLLALTSGKQVASSGRVTRSICAGLAPPSICWKAPCGAR